MSGFLPVFQIGQGWVLGRCWFGRGAGTVLGLLSPGSTSVAAAYTPALLQSLWGCTGVFRRGGAGVRQRAGGWE